MNVLKELSQSLNIDGRDYEINTDFKVWLEVAEKLSEKDVFGVFSLVFKELPENMYSAFSAVMNFFTGGEKTKGRKGKAVYDFAFDSELIYAAFWQQYRINLNAVKLHWWEFKALFAGLTTETRFVTVMGYRQIDLNTIKDKKERKFYRDMKRIYKLPDKRSEEEKEADFNAELSGLFG